MAAVAGGILSARRPRRIAVGLAAWLFLGACWRPSAGPAPLSTPEADRSAPAVSVDAGADASRPAVSPEMEARLAEADALQDPARTFAHVAQVPPPSGYHVPKRGPFPRRAVARAVLYTYNWQPQSDRTLAECRGDDAEPFTKEGTLCPDVVAPGVELVQDEIDRVIALVTEADEDLARAKRGGHYARPAHAQCDFDPHHAIGFYDARGVLRARILVSFQCREWAVNPGSEAVGDGEPAVMPPDASRELERLFDLRGLGAWAFGPMGERVDEYDRALYGAGDDPTDPIGAAAARRARRLASKASHDGGAPRAVPGALVAAVCHSRPRCRVAEVREAGDTVQHDRVVVVQALIDAAAEGPDDCRAVEWWSAVLKGDTLVSRQLLVAGGLACLQWSPPDVIVGPNEFTYVFRGSGAPIAAPGLPLTTVIRLAPFAIIAGDAGAPSSPDAPVLDYTTW